MRQADGETGPVPQPMTDEEGPTAYLQSRSHLDHLSLILRSRMDRSKLFPTMTLDKT